LRFTVVAAKSIRGIYPFRHINIAAETPLALFPPEVKIFSNHPPCNWLRWTEIKLRNQICFCRSERRLQKFCILGARDAERASAHAIRLKTTSKINY